MRVEVGSLERGGGRGERIGLKCEVTGRVRDRYTLYRDMRVSLCDLSVDREEREGRGGSIGERE